MHIITKKPLSAKYIFRPHPESFKTTLERDRYWAAELDKWIHGIALTNDEDNERLTGKHYFYLQEIMIPSQRGGLIHPNWRLVDEDIFAAIEICEAESRDVLVGKRRGLGLSSIFGGCLPLYYALTVPNTTVPLTSADRTRVEALITNIVNPAYTALNDVYKPEVIASSKSELYLGRKLDHTEKRDGKKIKVRGVEGIMSKILARQTHLKPSAFESIRAQYGFLDELFLHPKSNAVRASMSQCFGEGLEKNGWLAMGGSAGDENPESLKVAQELWLNAEKLGIVTLFIPGTRGNSGKCKYTGREFSINGWCQEDVAKEYIERRLEDLSQSTDLTEYRNFKHAMPLTVEDMFAIKKSEVFPPEVMDILNKQRTHILATHPKIHKGEVEENEKGEPIFKPDRINGKTIISQFPDKNEANIKNLYIGGIDPIPGNNAGEEGSEFANAIMNRQSKKIVAIRSERQADVKALTRKGIALQKLFHNCQALNENNQGTLVLDAYREEGVYSTHLADRPANLDIKYMEKGSKKGFNKTGSMAVRLHQLLVNYILYHGETIDIIEVIDDFFRYAGGENADITDAIAAALLADADWTRGEAKRIEKPTVHRVPTLERVNGVMKQVWKELRVPNQR